MTITSGATAGVGSSAEIPRPEYPRPQFDRSHRWLPLNGTWSFHRGMIADPAADEGWEESIQVPFAWETPASGVEAHWLEHAAYRRTFAVEEAWRGERVVLHFGAVHHEARVWVDGTEVGSHVGGSTPFELDVTDALEDGIEQHALVVAVHAPADKLHIAHGKQRSTPRDDYDSCAFTASSGIWQPVWLEARPSTHLSELRLVPTAELDGIRVSGTVAGAYADHASISLAVEGTGEGAVATWTGDAAALRAGVPLTIDEPRLWSPADPHLYRVRATVVSADGEDVVVGTTGLRSIETRGGQILLNGRRISLRGVLDQGYWPTTGITAPTDEAFVRDLEIARDAGFNLVRKHLKLEDPRFHHHADRLGMLVWAEPASTGRFSTAAAAAFSAQIEPMVARDGNHPSIVVWGLYNEEWGLDWALPEDPAKQEVVRNDYRSLKALDPTRPVVDNSGWTHLESDLIDWHVYDEHPAGWARKVADLVADDEPTFPVAIAVDTIVHKRLMVEGPVPRDVPFVNSEFGGGWTSIDRGWNLHWQTQELRRHDSIAGWVWTELNDIEHESAGIVDCNRTMKDHGGRPPQHANAETVPVFGVSPVAPGRDIVSADGTVDLEVAVSHHGSDPLEITVSSAWGPVFGLEPTTPRGDVDAVQVEPFVLSKSVRLQAELPAGTSSARLHVLLHADGRVVGRGAIDVVRD
ncbi:glycoside hydrolase family 2 TIM barrel-domain containing protein [Nocardioides sp. BP30]|uniref:glycoside hydrolase family 2 protein n=1 Tax=Nocardioides sp. BP30 TaxID=3036374 RepID=UPI00246858EE|nr:sugar-binding domain-containing protein [Nocardioides sp. BP30]WGL51397.1 glycoside hydrolase family 2 TIM barrel-domain containing protein [Nocardioides sp. BP30]